ncbi:F0F1 ATP synthase subunit A [Arcanobacterium pinnipediorum]|uniref:ATP synthase subunit a n=1 Tax=Arcanobacterium pinnipediorum TaxID=1503041 RepID=A0ABY5AHM4_9ACTO|nr:F0F1 ATP synthase subunit A [Arcanobacterium pinnipediorum]USR79715.1 F0F1 ATP synthase subunit A [Arcanobacterium pinnipediorum]
MFSFLNALASVPILLASQSGDSFTPPTLDHEFYPDPIWFAGTPFEIHRLILVRLIAVTVLLAVMVWYSRSAKLVPSRGQAVVESLLDFSRVQIGQEIIGEKEAGKYQPMLATVFIGILFMNITGVIPGLQIAGTSLVGMPLIFALFVFVGFILAGVKSRGFGRFFREQLFPPGVPAAVYILLAPLEFFSTFIMRPLTLTVRLLSNMVAGHFILVMCFLGTHYLYFQISGALGVGLGSLTLLVGVIFVVFELFVGALQAYIFAMLAAVYISLSISEH